MMYASFSLDFPAENPPSVSGIKNHKFVGGEFKSFGKEIAKINRSLNRTHQKQVLGLKLEKRAVINRGSFDL